MGTDDRELASSFSSIQAEVDDFERVLDAIIMGTDQKPNKAAIHSSPTAGNTTADDADLSSFLPSVHEISDDDTPVSVPKPAPKAAPPSTHQAESLAARRRRIARELATAFPEHCVTLDRDIAWFNDETLVPRPVPIHGPAADFSLAPDRDSDGQVVKVKSRSSAVDAPKYPFNNVWAALLFHIGVFEIGGPYGSLYFCWVLRTNAKQDSLWRSVQSDSALIGFWTSRQEHLAISARPVYVEKLNGGPFGSYAGALATDKRRIPSLFVQMYGLRNAVPCEACERNYRRNVNAGVVDGSAEQNPVRVMTPFFECVSLPGFSHGVCGNCLYNVAGNACSFHYKPPGRTPAKWLATKYASPEVEARLPPRRLSLTASPIIGSELGSGFLRQKTLNAKGRTWMGNQASFGRSVDWEGEVPTTSVGAPDQTPGTFNTTPKSAKSTKSKSGSDTPSKTPSKRKRATPAPITPENVKASSSADQESGQSSTVKNSGGASLGDSTDGHMDFDVEDIELAAVITNLSVTPEGSDQVSGDDEDATVFD